MLARHYSPRTPLILHVGDRASALTALQCDARQRLERGESVVVLAYTEDETELRRLPVQVIPLGSEANAEEIASRLYAALRASDELAANAILVRSIGGSHPLSEAILDRLRRAAAR